MDKSGLCLSLETLKNITPKGPALNNITSSSSISRGQNRSLSSSTKMSQPKSHHSSWNHHSHSSWNHHSHSIWNHHRSLDLSTLL